MCQHGRARQAGQSRGQRSLNHPGTAQRPRQLRARGHRPRTAAHTSRTLTGPQQRSDVASRALTARGICAAFGLVVGAPAAVSSVAGHASPYQSRAILDLRGGDVALLPRPSPGCLDLEREAQEGADEDDRRQHRHAGQTGRGGNLMAKPMLPTWQWFCAWSASVYRRCVQPDAAIPLRWLMTPAVRGIAGRNERPCCPLPPRLRHA